jgi:hypothetical protein
VSSNFLCTIYLFNCLINGLGRSEKQLRSYRAFHGTHPRNVDAIATNGLLRIGHPSNPSTSK